MVRYVLCAASIEEDDLMLSRVTLQVLVNPSTCSFDRSWWASEIIFQLLVDLVRFLPHGSPFLLSSLRDHIQSQLVPKKSYLFHSLAYRWCQLFSSCMLLLHTDKFGTTIQDVVEDDKVLKKLVSVIP